MLCDSGEYELIDHTCNYWHLNLNKDDMQLDDDRKDAKLRIPLWPRQDPPYEAARLAGVRHFTSSG